LEKYITESFIIRNLISIIIPKGIRLLLHVTHTRKIRNAYKILVDKPEGNRSLERRV